MVDLCHSVRKGEALGLERARKVAEHSGSAPDAVGRADYQHRRIHIVVLRDDRNQCEALVCELSEGDMIFSQLTLSGILPLTAGMYCRKQ